MTTKTAIRTGRKAYAAHGVKDLGALGGTPGEFEAIVAVFGNVDYANDRIVAGAFEKNLLEWAASGDPIPVIFSHQWDNLDAMIGEVIEAKELLPGDPDLPPELRMNGGLWVKFRLELDEDFAGRVAKKLTKRTLREFSFAYDVFVERTAADGANELVELGIHEVGPTLKGMNPATVLLSRAAKALAEGEELDGEWFTEGVIDNLREIGAGALADRISKALDDPPASGEKAYVTLTGSAEERQEAAYAAAFGWASEGNIGEGGFYAAYLEATFDDRVVVLVEGMSDPWGEGTYFELDVAFADGVAEVSNPRAVDLETTTVAKARAMKHRRRPDGSATGAKTAATVLGDDEPGKGKAKGAEPEEPTSRTGSDGDTDASLPATTELDLALLGAGLDPTDPTIP